MNTNNMTIKLNEHGFNSALYRIGLLLDPTSKDYNRMNFISDDEYFATPEEYLDELIARNPHIFNEEYKKREAAFDEYMDAMKKKDGHNE